MRFFCFDLPYDSCASRGLQVFSRLVVLTFAALVVATPFVASHAVAQLTTPNSTSPDLLTVPATPGDLDDAALSGGELPTDPLDAASVLLDALAQAEDGQAADALAREIQNAWNRSGSEAVDLLMVRASVAMRSRRFPIALDLLDTVIALAPDYAEGWNRRATVHFMRDDYASSIADVERVLRLEPRHFGALVGVGMILDDLGQDQEAALFLREALNVHPFLDNARERLTGIEARLQGAPI